MEITPVIPAGRQLIEAYGGGGFRIAGRRWLGSVLVFPGRTLAWPVATAALLTLDSLSPIWAEPSELLVLGSGRGIAPPPSGLRQALRDHGMGLEIMDTGAACRTFNFLLAEGRLVAAALIAID
jgi:uncharacterized protein